MSDLGAELPRTPVQETGRAFETPFTPDTQKLKDTWQRFRNRLELEGFGYSQEAVSGLEDDFSFSVRVVEELNTTGRSEHVRTREFEPNRLRYHNFDHTVEVIDKTLKMLPGFLAKLKQEGIKIDSPQTFSRIRGLVLASIFHEIGYLKQKDWDREYQTQGELYFDHVNRGMEFAPEILGSMGVRLTQEEENFFIRMIRATDFNLPWTSDDTTIQTKAKEGLTGELLTWGRVLEAADFLASFSHPDNIPRIVSGLYWENMSRIVMDGKVMTLARYTDQDDEIKNHPDWKGRIKLEKKNGKIKPALAVSSDPENDYATIIEYKFARDLPDPESPGFVPPYEANHDSLFQFVTSDFLFMMEEQLEGYLKYADFFYKKDETRDIRENYRINRDRIKLLQEAVEIKETDPFSIFEGAFTGHDLYLWTEELKREGLLASEFRYSQSWLSIDNRVLGTKGKQEALSRLVTAELKQILNEVTGDKSLAIKHLLERYRLKMRGENVTDVYLQVAPLAYTTSDGGPFADIDESVSVFNEAIADLEAKSDLPLLHPCWTVRRDKDFKDSEGKNDAEKMRQMAEKINGVRSQGNIARLAFLGVENENLGEFAPFFESLNEDIPMIVLFGQNFPQGEAISPEVRKERFIENVNYFVELSKRFEKLVLWGLQDFGLLSPQEKGEVVSIMPSDCHILLTLTPDQLMDLVPDIKDHPVTELISKLPLARVHLGSGDLALTNGSTSVALDALMLHGQTPILSNVLGFISRNGQF